MYKKVKTDFKVSLKYKQDIDYDFKIQKCIEVLLNKVVK